MRFETGEGALTAISRFDGFKMGSKGGTLALRLSNHSVELTRPFSPFVENPNKKENPPVGKDGKEDEDDRALSEKAEGKRKLEEYTDQLCGYAAVSEFFLPDDEESLGGGDFPGYDEWDSDDGGGGGGGYNAETSKGNLLGDEEWDSDDDDDDDDDDDGGGGGGDDDGGGDDGGGDGGGGDGGNETLQGNILGDDEWDSDDDVVDDDAYDVNVGNDVLRALGLLKMDPEREPKKDDGADVSKGKENRRLAADEKSDDSTTRIFTRVNLGTEPTTEDSKKLKDARKISTVASEQAKLFQQHHVDTLQSKPKPSLNTLQSKPKPSLNTLQSKPKPSLDALPQSTSLLPQFPLVTQIGAMPRMTIPLDRSFDAIISYVNRDRWLHVSFQVNENKNLQKLALLVDQLQRDCTPPPRSLTLHEVDTVCRVHQLVAVRLVAAEQQWYRGTVTKLLGNQSMAWVRFADYGYVMCVPTNNVAALPSRRIYSTFPIQSQHAFVPNVIITSSQQDLVRCLSSVKRWKGRLVKRVDCDPFVHTLDFYDASTGENIVDMLVRRRVAVRENIAVPPPPLRSPRCFATRDAKFVKCAHAVGATFVVVVVHVESIATFWALLSDDAKRIDALNKFNDEIDVYCSSHTSLPSRGYRPRLDEIVYARYTADDGKWYRAIVKETSPGNDRVRVFFADFGNVEIVAVDDVRPIRSSDVAFPFQAIRFRLRDAAVLFKSVDEFKKRCLGRSFAAKLVASEVVDLVELLPLNIIPPCRVPLDGKIFSVLVVSADGPDGFWAQVLLPSLESLGEMNSALNVAVRNASWFVDESTSSTLKVGEACCARFSTDGVWYRAEVEKELPCGRYYVRFVDFGNVEVVSFRDGTVRSLERRFVSCAASAACFRLHGIKPKGSMVWSAEARAFFSAEVLGKRFLAKVVKPPFCVDLVDTSGLEKSFPRENLIYAGFAVSATGIEK